MSLNSLQIRHIRSFLAVADLRSFVDAAQTLGVSQPALSQTISHFEQVLGVKLFERTTRSVELTEHGHALLKSSQSFDTELTSYFAALKSMRDGVRATIRVGYLIGTGVQFLPDAIRMFEKKYPNAIVELVEFDFNTPDAGLAGGTVDCAIIRPPIDVENVQIEHLMNEKCVVCLSDRHPLTEHDNLKIEQIKGLPVVAAPGAGVWQDYWMASDVLAEEKMNVVFQAATLDSELQAVASEKGISITAESTAKYYARPGVAFRPLIDMEDCSVAIGFKTGGSPRTQAFVCTTKAAIRRRAEAKVSEPAAN